MERLSIRAATVDLPGHGPAAGLQQVDGLAEGLVVEQFRYTGGRPRALKLDRISLLDGVVDDLAVSGAVLSAVRVDSVTFDNCDLSSLSWTKGRIARTRFAASRLLGARFDDTAMEHLVFEDCRLDYASFTGLKVGGPVVFRGCSLREARFSGGSLGKVLFDGCDLESTEFEPGGYAGCDLRGNDLSSVRGVANLRRVVIDPPQGMELAAALLADLEVSFGEE